jgi:hypothetical protein
VKKLKTFEGFSTEGPEPKFLFTEELGQKILDMGYVKTDLRNGDFFYKNTNNKEDIFDGSKFYVEYRDNTYYIQGGNVSTREFLAKNAKQV